jgi:hypothetical protein
MTAIGTLRIARRLAYVCRSMWKLMAGAIFAAIQASFIGRN